MPLYIFFTMFVGIALIFAGILGYLQPKMTQRKILSEALPSKRTSRHSLLANILPFSEKLLAKLKLEEKLKNKLDASHVKLNPQEFFNLKVLLVVLLLILSYFLIGKSLPLAWLIVVVLGYIIPDIWLKRKINQRRYVIARLLPETVDLLGLCIEAGLDFTAALNWIVEKVSAHNPLIEEFTFVLEEIKWGKPRAQALKDMAKRLNIPEVNSFVQVLVQSERLGTPVAEVFTMLSEDSRAQRFRRGERIALQAPIKILIPLIFCILPVIGIIIGGPILLQFMQGGFLSSF